MKSQRLAILAIAGVLIVAGMTPLAFADAAQPSLYARLGHYDGIAAVIDDVMPRVAGDPQLSHYFRGISHDTAKRMRQHLVDFVCQATGGPCNYSARAMKISHAGLGITEHEWGLMVGHLHDTLAVKGLGLQEVDELVETIARMKGDIVERP